MEAPHKNALRRSQVKADHFSVRDSAELDRTQTSVKIRILKGNHLLASDLMTKPPSSDPLIFGWCGVVDFSRLKEAEIEKEWGSPPVTECVECNENKGWDTNLDFRVSGCVKGTLNPTWDEEMLFDAGRVIYEYTEFERTMALKQEKEANKPMIEKENDENKENGANTTTQGEEEEVDVMAEPMDPHDVLKKLMNLKVMLYVRDADPYYNCKEEDIPEGVDYDDLGRVIIPLKDVIEKARYANGALVTNCVDHSIVKTPGMPALSYKLDLGSLTLGAQFVIGSDDTGKALKTFLGCPGPDSETGELTDKQLLKVLKEKTGKNAEKAIRARSASPASRFSTGRVQSKSPATPRVSTERPRTTGNMSLSRLRGPARSKSPSQLRTLSKTTPTRTASAGRAASSTQRSAALATFEEKSETEEGSQVEQEEAPEMDSLLIFEPTGGDESAPPPEETPKEEEPAKEAKEKKEVEGAEKDKGGEEDAEEKEKEEPEMTPPEEPEEQKNEKETATAVPSLGAIDKVAAKISEAEPSPPAQDKTPPKKGTKIPMGAGRSAAKSLRAAMKDDDGTSELQNTLNELKSLTRESLEDFAGRLQSIEKRISGDEHYKVREREQREANKRKSRERREEFRKFKEQARRDKAKRDAQDRHHHGPDVDFVHGSRAHGTVSHVHLDEGDQPAAPSGGDEDMPTFAFQAPGGGDEGANPFADEGVPDAGNAHGHSHGLSSLGHGVDHAKDKGVHKLNNTGLPSVAPAMPSPDWKKVDLYLRHGDAINAYNEVLDRGTPQDLGRLLQEGKVHPSLLSASILNRVCDIVSLLLMQGAGQYVETCLLFVLAILRNERGAGNPGQQGQSLLLLGRTRVGLSEALGMLASGDIPSKQAVLAGLLQAQLSRV